MDLKDGIRMVSIYIYNSIIHNFAAIAKSKKSHITAVLFIF